MIVQRRLSNNLVDTSSISPMKATEAEDYVAITHDVYGEPGDVLSISRKTLASLEHVSENVLVRVTKTPIHPGDLHMVRNLPNGGAQPAIKSFRVPGFEGVGVIERIGSQANAKNKLRVGQRVSFFYGSASAWASYVSVPASALIAVPDDVPDAIAAQMLINTVTAKIVLRAGHNAMPTDHQGPVSILQTAAGSAVGLLISRLALDLGVTPVRLVRYRQRAVSLLKTLPGSPVIATEDADWKAQVRAALGEVPLRVAIDSVGGSFLDEITPLLAHGGAIISFGWLGDGQPDLSGFAPNELSLRGAAISGWGKSSIEVRASDLQAAVHLAQKTPELFPVAAEYAFDDFQNAIKHVGNSKVGTVLLSVQS